MAASSAAPSAAPSGVDELVTGYTGKQLMDRVWAARWDGWLAALDHIKTTYREGGEELGHIPVAAAAMSAVAKAMDGFRHIDLMKKEFPNGDPR